MGMWEAIIAIVVIGVVSDMVKSALKRRGASGDLKREIVSKDASIQKLKNEVARLESENEKLAIAFEEQRILADEAVSTFGSRLDRLRRDQSKQQPAGTFDDLESE